MTDQERYMTTTPFQVIYDSFLGGVTDDMYMEWTKQDTYSAVQDILISIIPGFEFPKFKLYDYDPEYQVTDKDGNLVCKGRFNFGLTLEEVSIFSGLMLVEWCSRQITTIDITRMKYGSSDFKLTSQANHLDKLLKMKKDYSDANKHAQKLYGRRRVDDEGYIRPNYSGLGGGVLNK